ncbi:hypothetical protein F5883DRAFT_510197, partial [Diaporthe sp. PMI_573]
MVPLVRPPCHPPTAETAAFTPTRVCLRHPGYTADNILLTLPAVDGTEARIGLHHRTLLTAGAIISGNTFSHAYLTRDRTARERVDITIPLDGLLEPGDYWLQVRATHAFDDPYPIVLSFGDWQFPHNNIPSEWKQRHPAPPMNPPSALYTSSAAAKVTRRCCITGFQMGLNGCHLVPKNQGVWWANNVMRLFASSTVGELGDEANQVLLRADVHMLLDNHHFTIVPKPSPSGLSSSHAFATHVLKDDDESREFRNLYHNIALAQTAVDRIRPEFLFVRFAWAIFSHLQTFISSPARRHLAVTLRNETGPGSCITNTKMMNGREVNDFLTSRGLTRSGSRKRSSSQVTQDEWDVGTEDIYQERWERRSRQFSDANTSFDYLDPETSRIRDNTQWYDEVGQFSRARDFRQEQIERNSRWYERNFEQHSEITATEVPEADDYNECDDIDLERGRDSSLSYASLPTLKLTKTGACR